MESNSSNRKAPDSPATDEVLEDIYAKITVIDRATRAFLDSVEQDGEGQVRNFVAAFHAAVDAAQHGHTAASDCETLARCITEPDADKAKKDESMKGMAETSARGLKKTSDALEGFRAIRRGIISQDVDQQGTGIG